MISIHLKRKSDGKVILLERRLDWPELEFMWTDGNYSCDCNRTLLFNRELGVEDRDAEVCGNSAYSIRVTDAMGAELYTDETTE